jgi:drug/metabolite transporter (DMT)-like permease
MTSYRVAAYTAAAMIAFAGNSLLCRLALRDTALDAASFTAIRIVSGAVVLAAIVAFRGGSAVRAGSWLSALALFAYAIFFSFAYLTLPAGTGALVLFAAVQATMIGRAFAVGERFRPIQSMGLAVAAIGLIVLVLPGLGAPDPLAAAMMTVAGIAWGVYSLRGRGVGDPLAATAGNFLRAVPFALVAAIVFAGSRSLDPVGVGWALASGAVASGLGYAIWYAALPSLGASIAATVQLSVPPIAAILAVLLLGEAASVRLAAASLAVLGGIAVVILGRRRIVLPPSSR